MIKTVIVYKFCNKIIPFSYAVIQIHTFLIDHYFGC